MLSRTVEINKALFAKEVNAMGVKVIDDKYVKKCLYVLLPDSKMLHVDCKKFIIRREHIGGKIMYSVYTISELIYQIGKYINSNKARWTQERIRQKKQKQYDAPTKKRLAFQYKQLKEHLDNGLTLSKSCKIIDLDYKHAKWLLENIKEFEKEL